MWQSVFVKRRHFCCSILVILNKTLKQTPSVRSWHGFNSKPTVFGQDFFTLHSKILNRHAYHVSGLWLPCLVRWPYKDYVFLLFCVEPRFNRSPFQLRTWPVTSNVLLPFTLFQHNDRLVHIFTVLSSVLICSLQVTGNLPTLKLMSKHFFSATKNTTAKAGARIYDL